MELKKLTNWLEKNGWKLIEKGKKLFEYQPPVSLKLNKDYILYVPNSERFSDYKHTIDNVIKIINGIYGKEVLTLVNDYGKKFIKMNIFEKIKNFFVTFLKKYTILFYILCGIIAILGGFSIVNFSLLPTTAIVTDQRKNITVGWSGNYQCFPSSINNALHLNGFFDNPNIENSLKSLMSAELLMLISQNDIGKRLWKQVYPKRRFPKKPFCYWWFQKRLVMYILNNCSFEGIETKSRFVILKYMSIKEINGWLEKGLAVVMGRYLFFKMSNKLNYKSGHIFVVKDRVKSSYKILETWYCWQKKLTEKQLKKYAKKYGSRNKWLCMVIKGDFR